MIRHSALLPALLLAACSGGDDNRPVPVALVSLGTASQGGLQHMLTLYGAVQNDSAAQYALSAPIDAVVEDIAAPVGSAGGPGAVVARLRPTPATRSGMTSAASAAQAAQKAYARAQRLRADGLASDADVESARSAAAAAEAQQGAMAASARELTLRARSSGYVETVPVNPGDVVAAGAVVATLSRGGRLRASFGVDPATARQL